MTDRYRKTDSLVNSHAWYDDYNAGSNTISSTTTYSTGRKQSGSFKDISDIYDPSYFKTIKKGGVVLHRVGITSQERTCVPSEWTFGPHPAWGMRKCHGSWACEFSSPPSGTGYSQFQSRVAEANDLALVEAFAKMNSPDELFSAFWVEREKTLVTVRRPFGEAADLAERIFARKMKLIQRGFTAAKAFTSAWLEYRFGWRPLIQDIAGIAKAAQSQFPGSKALLVKRGGADRTFTERGVQTVSAAGLTNLTRAYDWDHRSFSRAGVIYRYRDLNAAEWRARCLGLTVDQVPSHIWEVTPYSFVVDYFVKVGLWLQAVTPNPDVVVLGNWVSNKYVQVNRTDITQAYVHIVNAPTTDYYQSGGSYTEKLTSFTRSVDQPLKSIPPMAGIPLSFSQSVDIATLIFQKAKGSLVGLR